MAESNKSKNERDPKRTGPDTKHGPRETSLRPEDARDRSVGRDVVTKRDPRARTR